MPPYRKYDVEECGNCMYFRQHYVKIGADYFSPISYGHCTFPRRKRRETGDFCPHWKEIQREELPD